MVLGERPTSRAFQHGDDCVAKTLAAVLTDDSAATMVEYAIMVSLIAAVSFALVKTLGTKVSGQFSSVNSAF